MAGPEDIAALNAPASDGSSTAPSEIENPPPQGDSLTAGDVFSLIVNKMIGTGIYNNPSPVLILTGSKGLAMGLWVLGFIYTLISMYIYLGFSTVLPYTGGELVYLDEVSSTRGVEATGEPQKGGFGPMGRRIAKTGRKLLGDGLLLYTVYSLQFVAFFNSSTNSLQVGHQVLIAIDPTKQPSGQLLRLYGFIALSTICLVQCFSTRWGRELNIWFAILKILFLVIVVIAGANAAARGYVGTGGRGFEDISPCEQNASKKTVAKAMLLIIFGFEGWENATFVAGEIDRNKDKNTLKKGFISAVLVVGLLYICIAFLFLYAVPYSPTAITSYAALFFGGSLPAYRVWAIFTGISALGSINSVIYTYSRIKQCIGQGNILPWSRLWKLDSPDIVDSRNLDSDKSPWGGIFLHWFTSTVWIIASTSVGGMDESISLPGLFQTYSHCIMLALIGVGFCWLPKRATQLGNRKDSLKSTWSRLSTRMKFFLTTVPGLVYAAINILLLIVSALRPYVSQDVVSPQNWQWQTGNKTLLCNATDKTAVSIPFPFPPNLKPVPALTGWLLPAVTFGVLLLGLGYTWLIFGTQLGFPNLHPVLDPLGWAGLRAVIDRKPFYDNRLEEVRRFGSRRQITYAPIIHTRPSLFYWLFGGRSLYRSQGVYFDTPAQQVRGWKNETKAWIFHPQASLRERRERLEQTGNNDAYEMPPVDRQTS